MAAFPLPQVKLSYLITGSTILHTCNKRGNGDLGSRLVGWHATCTLSFGCFSSFSFARPFHWTTCMRASTDIYCSQPWMADMPGIKTLSLPHLMHAISIKQGPRPRITENGNRKSNLDTMPGWFSLSNPVRIETLHDIHVCPLSGRQQSAGDIGKAATQMPLAHCSEAKSTLAFHPAREATCWKEAGQAKRQLTIELWASAVWPFCDAIISYLTTQKAMRE